MKAAGETKFWSVSLNDFLMDVFPIIAWDFRFDFRVADARFVSVSLGGIISSRFNTF